MELNKFKSVVEDYKESHIKLDGDEGHDEEDDIKTPITDIDKKKDYYELIFEQNVDNSQIL